MHHDWIIQWFTVILLLKGSFAVLVDVSPRENIVVPRQNVTFLCRVGVPLQYCRAEIPGLGTLNLNPKLPPKGGVSYYGAGLSAGQCGFTIDSVREENNGKVKCFLGIETEYQEPVGTMHLTVARAPKAPELDVSRGTDSVRVYKRNDVLHASCIVRDGRPVANISWYLDDEPLYGDGLSMPTIIDFAKEDLHSKVQNLTRILQATDNGKLLKCIATHPALPGESSVASRQLDVKYPPLPLGNPIDKFGYELGKAGTISVEIDANPKPQLEWAVRDQRIKEGSIDSTGRIEAESATDLGRGRYIANLRIAAITKQDTETQYILTAYNDMGTQDYTVLISSSPEPEGFEFSVASIIGIIVSLLIILLIVFIVIFARITGRWCFSVNPERRGVTETSDTESADIRPKLHQKKASSQTTHDQSATTPRRLYLPPIQMPPALKRVFNRRSDRVRDFSAERANSDNTSDTNTTHTLDMSPATDNVEHPNTTVEVSSDAVATNKPDGGDTQQPEGIVYAELDLVKVNREGSPMVSVKPDEDKTEYAEIIYTQKEAEENKEKGQVGENSGESTEVSKVSADKPTKKV